MKRIAKATLKTSLFLATAVAFCSGCSDQGVSDSTRAERQDLAFDVAGKYAEDAATGVPMRLTISKETSVHDVAAVLEMPSGFRSDDRASLVVAFKHDDNKLTDAEINNLSGQIEAAMASLQLGAGMTFTERGGENIASDHAGDLAEIALRKSIGSIGVGGGHTYTATISLFLTGYRGESRLDTQPTTYTDSEGMGSKGAKGLLLSVSRADAGVNHDVTNEMPLTMAALLKY